MSAPPIFAVEETHGRVLRPGNELIAHSPDAGWQSLYAAKFREAPLRSDEAALGHPSLIYHISHPTRVARKIAGAARESSLLGPGCLCLTPGDASAYWQHSGNPEILQLYLRRSVYEGAVTQMYGDGALVKLVPRFGIVDPLLEQLAFAVINALRDGSADDRLYIESIAHLIGVHLARTHSTRAKARADAVPDGLSRARIRRLLDYIEQHLGENLSLESLAAEVDLSPLYLVRAFRATVGQSPHQYVVARRVELAKRLLRRTATPIAEIALAAGFSSQSHLTNWFRRSVGISPAAFRRRY